LWKNVETLDAVLMRISQVGESASKTSAEALAEVPDVEWRDIKVNLVDTPGEPSFIADAQIDAARTIHEALRRAGLRSHLDERSETLNYKIRDAETHKVPYMAVVGQREAGAGTVAVRARGEGKKQVVLPLQEFVARLQDEVRTRALNPLI